MGVRSIVYDPSPGRASGDALTHHGNHFVWRHWFAQQACNVEPFVVARNPSHDDHGNVARVRSVGKVLEHHMPTDERQSEIQNNRVWPVSIDRTQRVQAVTNLPDREPGEGQCATKHPPQLDVVFHDEDSSAGHPTNHARTESVGAGSCW